MKIRLKQFCYYWWKIVSFVHKFARFSHNFSLTRNCWPNLCVFPVKTVLLLLNGNFKFKFCYKLLVFLRNKNHTNFLYFTKHFVLQILFISNSRIVKMKFFSIFFVLALVAFVASVGVLTAAEPMPEPRGRPMSTRRPRPQDSAERSNR